MQRAAKHFHPKAGFFTRSLLCALAGLACLTVCSQAAPAQELRIQGDAAAATAPLPADPTLITGTFRNGLAYIICPRKTPTGRLVACLQVNAGSANEEADQRSAARLVELVTAGGAASFAPGEFHESLAHLGALPARDVRTETVFDTTRFIMTLNRSDDEAVTLAARYFSGIASSASLDVAAIDAQRRVILAEERSMDGANMRINATLLPRIIAGSLLAERLPYGLADHVLKVPAGRVTDFHSKWYVPSNMTAIVIGDVTPKIVIHRIQSAFDRYELADEPQQPDSRLEAAQGRRVLLATDPDLSVASVQYIRISRSAPPITTEAGFRSLLAERLATAALDRRLSRRALAGTTSVLRGGAAIESDDPALRLSRALAVGQPADARTLLADLCTELLRALTHGFSGGELAAARDTLLAGYARDSSQDPTLPHERLLDSVCLSARIGHTITSAKQREDLAARMLPTISPEETSTALRRLYPTDSASFVILLPEVCDPLSEDETLRIAGTALAQTVGAPEPEAPAPGGFLGDPPRPGRVAELAMHPASGVLSAWLENGVRVHHREPRTPSGSVTISVCLAGGCIEETAATRGLSQATRSLWNSPASRDRTALQIADLLARTSIIVKGDPRTDEISLAVSCSPDDLEQAMQLLFLVLERPRVERAPLARWRLLAGAEARHATSVPYLAAERAFISGLVRPENPRRGWLEIGEAEGVEIEAAQAWVEGLVARAPIEVAIVGDAPRARALELASAYLGALPSRPRITRTTLATERNFEPVEGPSDTRVSITTPTRQGVAMVGFRFEPRPFSTQALALDVAARVLTSRLTADLRDNRQLISEISVEFRAARPSPALGAFRATCVTEPDLVETVGNELDAAMARMASEGPTPAELEAAKAQAATELTRSLDDSGFWASFLAGLEYNGRSLDAALAAPQAAASLTTEQVRSEFAAAYEPKNRRRVIVTPVVGSHAR